MPLARSLPVTTHVWADRNGAAGVEQQLSRLAFGGAGRGGSADVRHRPVAIIEQHMARVRELRFATVTLAREAGVRIRGGLMGVVPSRFPVEVHGWVARGLVRPTSQNRKGDDTAGPPKGARLHGMIRSC